MTGITLRGLIKLLEKQKTINKGQIGGKAGHDANTLIPLEEIKVTLMTSLAKRWQKISLMTTG
eukprot:4051054-Ditylum_brightwellii.AAC.1